MKMIDFGIAALGHRLTDNMVFIGFIQLLGPLYMSPEQAALDDQETEIEKKQVQVARLRDTADKEPRSMRISCSI